MTWFAHRIPPGSDVRRSGRREGAGGIVFRRVWQGRRWRGRKEWGCTMRSPLAVRDLWLNVTNLFDGKRARKK